MSFLEFSIDCDVLIAAESESVKFEVGDLLAEPIRNASGDEMDAVFAELASHTQATMLDIVVGDIVEVLDGLPIEAHLECVAVHAHSIAGCVVELDGKNVMEWIVVFGLATIAALLAIASQMGWTEGYGKSQCNEESTDEQ